MRQPISTDVVLVVLEVDVLVVLELVLLEVLLEVLELVDVLVVVVITSVPSCLSSENAWSMAASWSVPWAKFDAGLPA
jgi:hypothetical protein